MPRVCSICTHAERERIDAAIVGGATLRDTSALFRVSEDALTRHAAKHLPQTLLQARGIADAARADSLLDQLRDLQSRTLGLLEQAERAGKLTPAVLAVNAARANLELMAKLLHELDDRPHVNLVLSPEWIAVRAALVEVLRPYPDAATAVASRLLALDGA